jgi:hypothetical protein
VTALAADVAIAIELIDRAEVRGWPRLTEDLMHSPPRIHARSAEQADALVAWLAPYADLQPSLVQAAVANFAGVLADLLLALHYDLNVETPVYHVPKWYRLDPRSVLALEQWEIHVCLIHNLTVELTRAINLVIARTRQADTTVLAHQPSAVCDSGPPHAPLQAVTYTGAQSDEAQPYPGLERFPAVIESRSVGGLGVHEGDVPRTADEFDQWIASLVERRGQCSKPPPPGAPPFALRKPEPSTQVARSIPRPLAIVITVLGSFATIGGVIAYPWLAGAAITAALVTAALHQYVWRWPPNRIALLVVAVATVCGGVLGQAAPHIGGGPSRPIAPKTQTQSSATANAQRSSADGQIEAGNFFRGGLGSVAAFADPLLVPVEREFRLGVRLSDAGPNEIPDAVVRVTLPNVAATSASVSATVRAEAAYPHEIADTATVNFESNQSACLRYVAASTQLLDSHHGLIRALPDGVVQGGVAVGALGVPLTDVRYVVFSLISTAVKTETHCP